MLASAGAWNALSTEYTEVAEELSALVGGVQASAWEGPSAESYVAANAPYVAWLLQAAAKSTAMATQQQTAATAYTAALAAMPTLPELAANHAIHAVLLATNFFGINTIPIALNEADYVRMWIQAATTMTTYQAVSTAAVAAAPPTTPAPQIVKADATGLPWYDWTLKFTYPVVAKFVELLGYNPPPLQVLEHILAQYANGYPIASGSWLQQIEAYWATTFGGPGSIVDASPAQNIFFFYFNLVYLLPADIHAVLQGTPAQIFSLETIAALFKQVIMTLGNVIGLGNFAVQNPAYLTPLLPLLTPGLAGTAGFAGLAGLAQQAAALPIVDVPAPVPGAPLPAFAASPTPLATPTGAPAPAPAPAPTAVAASPAPAPPPPAAPPPLPPATPGGFPYLVGDFDMGVQASARAKTDEPLYRSGTKAPVVPAAATREAAPARRRRRTKVEMLGRGYEYMDLDQDLDSVAMASDQSAGPLGFAGTAAKGSAGRAAGLATLPGDEFGSGPTMPMLPDSWGETEKGESS